MVVLQLWGLALGIGNQTYTSRWQYIAPGFTQWQVRGSSVLQPAIICLTVIFLRLRKTFSLAEVGKEKRQAMLCRTYRQACWPHCSSLLSCLLVLPYRWTWPQSLLFGAIAAATDPVAAVALLKEVMPFTRPVQRRC